jgi:SAM-dependent methyltransferase
MSFTGPTCQACGTDRLHEIPGFADLPRVTSDSKPFRNGGRLFVCGQCGLVQKAVDAAWLAEIEEIYGAYEMYHQSAALDQPVFDPASGSPSGRCEVLARQLRESAMLPESGALLDVGAGSGAMLAAFSAACPRWSLFGLDLDRRKEPALMAIPRFQELFTVPPERLARGFDLVTLIHSLEHFTDPLSMLQRLAQRLDGGGRLFIEVNNVDRMPFDLVVADHLCHFNPVSLGYMVSRAGLGVMATRDNWINKEISLLANAASHARNALHGDPTRVLAQIRAELGWLAGMLEHARLAARNGDFGIFGTSVAATWLAAGVGDAVGFFVDEDPARRGRTHLGRPILSPAEAPRGSVVYLAFIREVAEAIRHRLAALPLQFAAPAGA